MGNDFDVVEEVFEDTPTPQASDVRHPEVHVSLTGLDGEAFSILGTVQKAMRRAGVSKEECSLYLQEATAGDYDELLQVTMRWVDWS